MKIKQLVVIGTVFLSLNLTAQNAKEVIQNTQQIAEGKKNLERDTKELEAFKLKTVALAAAFESKNVVKSNELKASLYQDMLRELAQSKEKAAKARREISQSSQEVRSERREIRRDKEDSDRGRYDRRDDERDLARDRVNAADDRRDRRDDMRDFQAQIDRAERQGKIVGAINAYTFSYEGAALEQATVNKNLIMEFQNLLQQDIVATQRELNEDIRESREDRRERRDDRNERKEVDSKIKRRTKW